jgi:hypothetical protein
MRQLFEIYLSVEEASPAGVGMGVPWWKVICHWPLTCAQMELRRDWPMGSPSALNLVAR